MKGKRKGHPKMTFSYYPRLVMPYPTWPYHAMPHLTTPDHVTKSIIRLGVTHK